MSLFSLILGLIIGFLSATESSKIKGFAGLAKDKVIDSVENYIGELAIKHTAKKAAKSQGTEETAAKAENTTTKVEDMATKVEGI